MRWPLYDGLQRFELFVWKDGHDKAEFPVRWKEKEEPVGPPAKAPTKADAKKGAPADKDEQDPPAKKATKKDEKDKKSWIDIHLVDDHGHAVAGARFKVELADQSILEGVLDEHGKARIEGLDAWKLPRDLPRPRRLETRLLHPTPSSRLRQAAR